MHDNFSFAAAALLRCAANRIWNTPTPLLKPKTGGASFSAIFHFDYRAIADDEAAAADNFFAAVCIVWKCTVYYKCTYVVMYIGVYV